MRSGSQGRRTGNFTWRNKCYTKEDIGDQETTPCEHGKHTNPILFTFSVLQTALLLGPIEGDDGTTQLHILTTATIPSSLRKTALQGPCSSTIQRILYNIFHVHLGSFSYQRYKAVGSKSTPKRLRHSVHVNWCPLYTRVVTGRPIRGYVFHTRRRSFGGNLAFSFRNCSQLMT